MNWKFWNKIPKAKDKSQAKKLFRERYKYYIAKRQLRAAAEFMDFIYRLDPQNTKTQQQLAEIRSMLAFSKIMDY